MANSNAEIVKGLRKIAKRLRKQAEREGKRPMQKRATALDPRKVLDFMLFYGR